MRASQPDAALYYMCRMIDAGEDPLIIARRMVVFASEDLPAMAIRLRAGQIEHVRVDDQLLVPNQAACGVAMLFRAA